MRQGERRPEYRAGQASVPIAEALLNWFAIHQRDLPWRRSRDPYRIWVSEVMLQQTRVETVIPYYQRWLEHFPTMQHLATASQEQVMKAWEGLGYYSRARNLQGAVREVVARYGGAVPDDPEAIAALSGVGPYTAGAILSIAFNRSVPAVDGNVMRVLSRLCLVTDDIGSPRTRSGMQALAASFIPEGQAGAFNQSLMELGALICTPVAPKCMLCPVSAHCLAKGEGAQDRLPVKAKARAARSVDMIAAVIKRHDRYLIARRPTQGLLGGLWEFPSGERPADLAWERAVHMIVAEKYPGLTIALESHLCSVKHAFTHLTWHLRAFTAEAMPDAHFPESASDTCWVTLNEMGQFAFPVAHRKIIANLLACSRESTRLQ